MKAGGSSIKPRLIFTGAELLDERARSLIKSSFEADVFDTYGTMEFSLLAWECKQHAGYHINTDSVVMEFLDDEEEVDAGEKGSVVCTGLNNYVMPLIRYKLDDIAVPQNEGCSCGIKLPLLNSLEGRENDFLVALDGRLISPMYFLDSCPFGDYAGIKQFKIVQDKRDRVMFHLAIDDDSFDVACLDKARSMVQKILGEEMQVDFETSSEIKPDNTGKVQLLTRSF